MNKIGIILTPDIRSKAYLKKIIDNQIPLNEIIFMNDNRVEKKFSQEIIKLAKKYGFDISLSVKDILKNSNLKFVEFKFVDINHPTLVDYLKKK